MEKIPVLVRHKTRPGARDKMLEVWTRHVQPRARDNPGHLADHFCFDSPNPDQASAFQASASDSESAAFVSGDGYPAYLDDVSNCISEPPEIVSTHVVWSKQEQAHHVHHDAP